MKFFLIKHFNLFKKTIPSLSRQQLGILGEHRAAQFLKKKKHQILNKNWKHKQHEIDLIARDKETIVFVEVKSRSKEGLVPLYYSVSQRQKGNIQQAAKAYLRKFSQRPKHFRFDIIEVYFSEEGRSTIQHHRNVALFSKYFQ